VCENSPIAEEDDYERKKHADGDVEESVLMRQCAIPETFLRLAVKCVCRPARVAWHVESQPDYPRSGDNSEACSTAEDAPIYGMMADIDVAIDADSTDAE